MMQIEPYHCIGCGAELDPLGPDRVRLKGWQMPRPPSSRGERVTGYYISHLGGILEMTFDNDHNDFNRRAGTTTSRMLMDGWVRITKLEGYAIDIPRFMTAKTRRALASVLKIIEDEGDMGDPYVKMSGDTFGSEMPRQSVMSLVSSLPKEPGEPSPGESLPSA
jgi:hypothetical protein